MLSRLSFAIAGCGCCCCLVGILVPFLVCKSTPVSSQVTAELADDLLNGKFQLVAKDMPAQQLPVVVSEAVLSLDSEPWKDVPAAAESTLTWGSGGAKLVIELMYNVTKVDGVWEKVPEKLRGIFWMKGNAIPEELAVLQYGIWSESQLHYLAPFAPFGWAWPLGKPADAPGGGSIYTNEVAFQSATTLTKGQKGDDRSPMVSSYSFTSEEMTFATLQVFNGDDLTHNTINMEGLLGMGPAWATGEFVLDAESQGIPQDGSQWNRGIKWGVGACASLGVEFGGYSLVKIIDGDGFPLQPHYNDFIAYIGDVPLVVWTGHSD